MAHISLRVSKDEKRIMGKYAEWHGVSLSDAIKSAVLEKIENEYDLRIIAEYEALKEEGVVDQKQSGEL